MTTEETTELSTPSRTFKVSLSRLYLDPNNYRFVDQPDYVAISDDKLTEATVQRRTTAFLLGKGTAQVSDLIASFQQNGWLEVDRILVRHLEGSKYLVVEGNRRIATLKHLQRRFENSAIDLGKLQQGIFAKVPVTHYSASGRAHHLMMMGLQHIARKKSWPPINQATMLRDLLGEIGDADAVRKSLGISRRELNLSLRTLVLCERYQASDYGDQFSTEMFTSFREVVSSPPLRKWLGLDFSAQDPTELTCKFPDRLERLFSWLSEEPDEPDEPDADGQSTAYRGKVLPTRQQVRELAKIIDDPTAIARLDETRSLTQAVLSSDQLVQEEKQRLLRKGQEFVDRLVHNARLLGDEELEEVETLSDRLLGVLLLSGRQRLAPSSQPREPMNAITQQRFSTLTVTRYRRLRQLELTKLRPLNLLVGSNNAGKTSVLEAVYLLTRLNDDRALVETIERRARVHLGQVPTRWLVEQLPEAIKLSGEFDAFPNNRVDVSSALEHNPNDLPGDQSAYLRTLVTKASYLGEQQQSRTVFQDGRPRRSRFKGDRWLCRAVFSSPFVADGVNTLQRHNKESFDHKTKTQVLDFIRAHFDDGIESIELTEAFTHFCAFKVSHSELDEAVDLSRYGQGLRRIFEIGLAFATARYGVLLIDEVENGIHVSLLPALVRLIAGLAERFDVQVFLTTHSGDTIRAFAEHGGEGAVANYLLLPRDGNIESRRFEGEQVHRLASAMDFDLRALT